jgi:hypothetical protein
VVRGRYREGTWDVFNVHYSGCWHFLFH